jgi:hypothetical protein
MKVMLAFQKEPRTIIGSVIKWWTKSEYYHVEIILPHVDKDVHGGYWISANPEKGVRIKPVVEPLDYESWDYFEVVVNKSRYEDVMELLSQAVEFKYATLDLFLVQVLGLKKMEDRKRMFCSEIVAEVLLKFKEKTISKDSRIPVEYSQEDLYQMFKNRKRKYA